MKNKNIKYKIIRGNKKSFFSCLSVKQKRKIYSFFIISIFLISILIPSKISATTGQEHIELLYINLIKFTFPNIKTISKKDTGSLLSVFLKRGKEEDLINNEVSYLKEHKEETKERSNEGDKNDKEDIQKDLFKIDDKSVVKFEDNIKEEEILNKEGKEFKNSPFRNEKRPDKPQVLIYHSHTREGYLPGKPQEEDTNHNVVGVGEVIKNTLERDFNVNVIHDKLIHDTTYTKSYQNSGQTLDKYLKQYGDFDLIIDLHRDSLDSKKPLVCSVNGEQAARFMFVVATENPKFETGNKKVVQSLINITNKNYPGLIRGQAVLARKRGIAYYNQNKSSNAVLIEMGAQCNNSSECKNTGKYLSRVIAEYLKTKK
ncbi:stage II sporulation protein P [Hathewaya massiliensis]|uniref:stage II sporulation protein P n=1 Tax=Hathewaya massiliensis TaxID=1964382 RepID=UPI00163B8452|nr:stage II sporulation protein P [Hathewaya massiliensis]